MIDSDVSVKPTAKINKQINEIKCPDSVKRRRWTVGDEKVLSGESRAIYITTTRNDVRMKRHDSCKVDAL